MYRSLGVPFILSLSRSKILFDEFMGQLLFNMVVWFLAQ